MNGKDWSILDGGYNKQFLFLQQGNAVYRYQAGDEGPTRVYDFDLRGGTPADIDREGKPCRRPRTAIFSYKDRG